MAIFNKIKYELLASIITAFAYIMIKKFTTLNSGYLLFILMLFLTYIPMRLYLIRQKKAVKETSFYIVAVFITLCLMIIKDFFILNELYFLLVFIILIFFSSIFILKKFNN